MSVDPVRAIFRRLKHEHHDGISGGRVSEFFDLQSMSRPVYVFKSIALEQEKERDILRESTQSW